MNINIPRPNSSTHSKSSMINPQDEELLLAKYLGDKLKPIPFYEREVTYLKESNAASRNPTRPASGAEGIETGVGLGIPVYKKENGTIRSYNYLIDRSYIERSVYHKDQMLGKGSFNKMRNRKPQMKPGFVSKAEEDEKKEQEQGKNLIVVNEYGGKNKFFGKESRLEPPSASTGGGRGHHRMEDGRKTIGTLSYSDTMGRNPDQSGLNTVFNMTGKLSVINKNEEIGLEDLQKSARFGGMEAEENTFRKSGEDFNDPQLPSNSGSPENSPPKLGEIKSGITETSRAEHKSGFLSKGDLEELTMRRPENHICWFQFFTSKLYCCATSLVIILDSVEYKLPFGITKLVLSSRENMELFLKTAVLKPTGEYSIDPQYIEDLRGKKVDAKTFIKIDRLYLNKKDIRLILPLVRIYLRHEKRWIQRNMDLKELQSIPTTCDHIDLTIIVKDWKDTPAQSDPLNNLKQPWFGKDIPNAIILKSQVEDIENKKVTKPEPVAVPDVSDEYSGKFDYVSHTYKTTVVLKGSQVPVKVILR